MNGVQYGNAVVIDGGEISMQQTIDGGEIGAGMNTGTRDYNKLDNLPTLNGKTIEGEGTAESYSLQRQLVAGDNIQIRDNDDGTATISATGGVDPFFLAVKDITTFDELSAALDAGKFILFKLAAGGATLTPNTVIRSSTSISVRTYHQNMLTASDVTPRNTWTSQTLLKFASAENSAATIDFTVASSGTLYSVTSGKAPASRAGIITITLPPQYRAEFTIDSLCRWDIRNNAATVCAIPVYQRKADDNTITVGFVAASIEDAPYTSLSGTILLRHK